MSTDEVAGDTDWFDLGVTITVAGRPVPFLDVFLALSRGEPYLLLPDGAYFSLDKPELRALARLIEEARALQDAPGGPLRISRYQAGFWDELAALGVIGHQAAAWREQVQGLLSAGGPDRAGPPAGLRTRLRPYQQDGFGWLAFLWEHRLGGILADDMGLGKTLQCLALVSHARQRDPAGAPFLIVAPTSVVANWAAEAARFTPDLNVVTVSGTTARRGRGLGELAAGADVVVTSYTLLRIDFAAYAASGLVRAPARRGPAGQEPPVEDLPVRAAAGRAGEDRDHGHAAGEQPDGAVVAPVDHGARAVPRPGPVPRVLRPAGRAARRYRTAGPAPAPDQAAGPAPHQGAGGRRPAAPSRSRSWRSSCIRSTARSTRRGCSGNGRRYSG